MITPVKVWYDRQRPIEVTTVEQVDELLDSILSFQS